MHGLILDAIPRRDSNSLTNWKLLIDSRRVFPANTDFSARRWKAPSAGIWTGKRCPSTIRPGSITASSNASVGAIDGVINRHLTEFSMLDERGYLLYSGIMQGLLYAEMAEALRQKSYGAGDLIWMYNDCWPETGWTDYRLLSDQKGFVLLLKTRF